MGEMVLSAAEEMSVVDVYDLASDIGKECEKIIDLFGADSVTALMPKVITVLELLEAMAARNENENTKMQELTDRIAHLESEKLEKAVFRERFEKELEGIEEQWRAETNDLVSLVSRLQEENRRYQKQLSPTRETNERISKDESSTNLTTASDFQLLQRLRNQVDKHRNELKSKDTELQAKISEVENLSIQLERLTNSGRESRKRQKLLQVQVRSLVEERADFLAQLQDQHREIIALRKRLGIAEKENEDLTKCHEENDIHRARFTTAELKEILTERDELRLQISDLQDELKLYKPPDVVKPEEKTFVGLQKKILQSRGRFRMNPTMLHGKKPPNQESENFFVNYFRNQAQRVFLADHCQHYLKWLSLLVLIATISESSIAKEHSLFTLNTLPNSFIDTAGNIDIWFIK